MTNHANTSHNPPWPSVADRLDELPLKPANTWMAHGAHLIVSAEALARLRNLRLQQWLVARRATKRLQDGRCSDHTRKDYQHEHAKAMGFVQALNELFPPGDTAEHDEHRASAVRRGVASSVDRERLK